jgi:hypothetical protein
MRTPEHDSDSECELEGTKKMYSDKLDRGRELTHFRNAKRVLELEQKVEKLEKYIKTLLSIGSYSFNKASKVHSSKSCRNCQAYDSFDEEFGCTYCFVIDPSDETKQLIREQMKKEFEDLDTETKNLREKLIAKGYFGGGAVGGDQIPSGDNKHSNHNQETDSDDE